MNEQTPGKVAALTGLGLILGFLQPMLSAFCMILIPTPFFAALLFAWGGYYPALALIGTTVASFGYLLGTKATIAVAVVTAVPALAAIIMMERRAPFFKQMRAVAIVELACILAAVTGAYLVVRADLVDALMELFSGWLAVLPQSLSDQLLMQFSAFGFAPVKIYESLVAGTLDAGLRAEGWQSVREALEYSLKLALPGMILSSSLLTGVLTTSVPRLICARRGDEPSVPYVPVSEWFLPGSTVAGMLLCIAAGFIIAYAGLEGGDSVLSAILSLAYTLAAIQGVAAMSRRFKGGGMPRGRRVALIALGALLATVFVRIYGAMSALFGRHGLVSGYIKRKHDEQNGGDDER